MEARRDGAPATPRGTQPDHRVDEKAAVVVQQLVIAAGRRVGPSPGHLYRLIPMMPTKIEREIELACAFEPLSTRLVCDQGDGRPREWCPRGVG
jgi:hypothetical protein